MNTTTQMSKARTHGDLTIVVAEPSKFVKRIGSATYVVTVRFSENAKRSLDDKIMRLIEGETQKSNQLPQTLKTAERSGL